LPEPEIPEVAGIVSRYKRHTHKIRYLNQLSTRSDLKTQYHSWISSQCQLMIISLRTVLPMGITVRCNWSTGFRSLYAGSLLGQIAGCNFPTDSDHNISKRCYRQHHHSLSLYVTDQLYTVIQTQS